MSDSWDELFKRVGKISADHASEVGGIAVAWNRAHYILSEMFVGILNPKAMRDGFSVWHSMKSDRAQRDALEALISGSGLDQRYKDEYLWALGELGSLAGERNDTIHAPYKVKIDGDNIQVVPDILTGSGQAKRLSEKALSSHLSDIGNDIGKISMFILEVRGHQRETMLGRADRPLPDRPLTRRRVLALERERQKAQKRATRRPPPPKPSRG